MKKHRLIFATVALLTTGISLAIIEAPASAHSQAVMVPTSLRGTWYHYDSSYNGYEKFHATKYHLKISGVHGTRSYSGVEFPKYAGGHAQMYVSKTSKGYYKLGAYATDDESFFKRVTHKGHAALKQPWHEIPDTGTYVDYWYRTKSIAKNPNIKYNFKTAKSTDFYYNMWQPAYLDQESQGARLYKKNSKEYMRNNEPDKVVTSYTKKMSAKWLSQNQSSDIIKVRVDSKEYYMDDSDHDIHPYNAFKAYGEINSMFKPTDKRVILKHGNYAYKNTKWYKYNANRSHVTYYKFNGKKWVYIKSFNV